MIFILKTVGNSMNKYLVTSNDLSNFVDFGKERICLKLTEGSLKYKIDENLMLEITNYIAPTKNNSSNPIKGTHSPKIDLKPILEGLGLTIRGTFSTAKDLIGANGGGANNNNAGFICAVLIDLGLVVKS